MTAQQQFPDLAEIVVIKEANALTTFCDREKLDPILAKVRAFIDDFEGDASTEEGREKIKKMAFAVVKSKTALEAVGDNLAKDMKELPKKIDAGRRHVKETLDAWRDEVRKPLTDWETAEDARVKRHTDELEALKLVAGQPPGTADDIRKLIAKIEAISDGPDRQEFAEGFKIVKAGTLRALRETLEWREQYDRDQADLAKLRAEAAAREAEEAERRRVAAEAEAKAEADRLIAEAAARAVEQAAERERAAVEQERLAAEKRAQAERDAAARREADLKEQAEAADRRAREAEAKAKADLEAAAAAQRAEQKRREDDKEHRRRINATAVAAMVKLGLSDGQVMGVLTAIIKGEIPSVSVNY